ncbi:MAG: macrolide ABC transporter ATP-binding protein [Candidatus Magasanikbacteria bacterium RIFCSPHIGHO2_12_FULL_41_16]|uniref:Macrolide ABC transporter ATP-binding protein n=1 Tax=Candidatus Magasanikbacteria bacterium RIFCSPLOWO2_01_FULL_40_15 TaxID=1798686 RepID=A0A1F6N048_9BACT|nr:MAG: macrolide ABC transporter ATP-binding protein [Alphaproteobacteria bacterium RIFCSPHIGHO2_01_FULL_40_8]OGH74759.1 MAG: macrolide ABC transporter ATP-binding protein [Candidatus Magasanikbacteria bacterium RIFCSPHIGHO2_12_FULL_41_16]OGH77251.1 MAG: macrolide ABC transporter ATP-binding protein [Candidatus Magasanikbacteria bacterium RIFCSPLOWO2_01_FULL_40_15]
MTLISVKSLNKNYQNGDVLTPVLKNISFEIQKGEFVAIMGPSGSGKSTLMHILGFLDTLSSGEYYFDNQNINHLSDNELARMRNEKVGFIFQAFNLLPRTSATENVILPLLYSSVKKNQREQAIKVLESVGLGHRLEYMPNQLSGGERQRVAIARALVNNPDIIFADEPTGNLDSKSGLQVMKILQSLNDKGHTIILVTHERHTADHAKRILQIKDGEIISDENIAHRQIANGSDELKK